MEGHIALLDADISPMEMPPPEALEEQQNALRNEVYRANTD